MPLWSGTGEKLGIILGVESDRFGVPKWLSFLETADAPPRKVRLDHVRGIDSSGVQLKGPREGYHITRLRG